MGWLLFTLWESRIVDQSKSQAQTVASPRTLTNLHKKAPQEQRPVMPAWSLATMRSQQDAGNDSGVFEFVVTLTNAQYEEYSRRRRQQGFRTGGKDQGGGSAARPSSVPASRRGAR